MKGHQRLGDYGVSLAETRMGVCVLRLSGWRGTVCLQNVPSLST